jgi:Uma2 family endonuclease
VPRAAIWVNEDTYLEPDLMYLSEELQAQMDPRHWTRADIVVEVISPSNALYDRRTKADTYRAMGVRELWLVDAVTREVELRSFAGGTSRISRARCFVLRCSPESQSLWRIFFLRCRRDL